MIGAFEGYLRGWEQKSVDQLQAGYQVAIARNFTHNEYGMPDSLYAEPYETRPLAPVMFMVQGYVLEQPKQRLDSDFIDLASRDLLSLLWLCYSSNRREALPALSEHA